MRANFPERSRISTATRLAHLSELRNGLTYFGSDRIIDFRSETWISTKGMVDVKIYHGRELRKGRCSEIQRPYLITTVTFERRRIFRDLFLGRLLVAEMRDVTERDLVDSLAWVIMPDHVHWLVTLRAVDLSTLMNRIKSRSAVAINRRANLSGRVWQKGFHDHAIREEEDIEDVARYVVANPLRAGLVKKLGDYPLWDAIWM